MAEFVMGSYPWPLWSLYTCKCWYWSGVMFHISSLHVQKASGTDGLSALFIRASSCMARLVSVLINKCIESSLFPFQWNQAITTPVSKCNQCISLTHYWPISVLLTLSKVVECVLYNQIQSHIVRYDIATLCSSIWILYRLLHTRCACFCM